VGALGEDSNATGVGGNQADNSASNAGAVYVFIRSGSTWVQQAYVKASNTGALDQFGWSVALSADGSTLAVGAPDEDSNATGLGGNQTNDSLPDAGAVYVFSRSGSTWVQQAYVKASNTGEDDYFGYSVALSADGNTLAVGALYEDSNATGVGGDQTNNSASQSGAVYVFIRSGSTWLQQAYVKPSNTEGGDFFGGSVALSADGNTLAVGAVGEDSNAIGVNGNQADNSSSGAGAVYVFSRSGSAWVQQAYVKASNTGGYFGDSVALSADGNTLAVGATNEASNATGIGGDQTNNSASAGAVYLY
jgi:predicted porin